MPVLFAHYPCKCLDSINLSRLLYNSLVPSLQMRKCCWHLNYSNMASSVSALLCLAVCLFVCLLFLLLAPKKKFSRAKVIESWLHQPHHRYQKWIFDWYTSLFPGRYIPVVTSPWVPTCGGQSPCRGLSRVLWCVLLLTWLLHHLYFLFWPDHRSLK